MKQTLSWWITTLATALVGILLAIFGATLLVISVFLSVVEGYKGLYDLQAALARDFGSFLLATGMLAVLWDLIGKRTFLREIIDMMRLSNSTYQSGLTRVIQNFTRNIEWKDLIGKSNQIDIFFSYATTWRSLYNAELYQLGNREDVNVNIILPNPQNETVINELANRYGYESRAVVDRINGTREFFEKIPKITKESNIRVWYSNISPVYAFYRFDDIIILTLYRHGSSRMGVPILICKKGGWLFEFVLNDIVDLTAPKSLLSQQVYPESLELPVS